MKIEDIKKKVADGNIHHYSCVLLAMAVKNKGNWEGFLSDLDNQVRYSDKEIADLVNSCDFDGECTFIIDSDYPDAFKDMSKPPFVVFHNGNLAKLDKYLSSDEVEKIMVCGGIGFGEDYELYLTENPRYETDECSDKRTKWLADGIAERFRSGVIVEAAMA